MACIMGLTFLEINRDMDSTPTGRLRSRYRVLGVGGRALTGADDMFRMGVGRVAVVAGMGWV